MPEMESRSAMCKAGILLAAFLLQNLAFVVPHLFDFLFIVGFVLRGFSWWDLETIWDARDQN